MRSKNIEVFLVLAKRARSLEKSKRLYERAIEFVTGGVHSGFRYQEPYPRYFARAKGPYLWDVDGNKYVDCLVSMGACILGHADPIVLQHVKKQLGAGLVVGLETELSIDAAELLSSIVPSAEIVKFSNTGTEAVMHAIQIARGCSGKNKIAKLEGGYNGWYDYALVSTHPTLEDAGPESAPISVPGSAGLAKDAATETIMIPFNNIDDSSRIIREHKDELAAVILEPVMFNVGCVTPKNDYLKAVRQLTEELGIILIFDEVISGFRLAPGGAQEYYGVTPDISTFGKAIANGFPLAAVTGKKEYMNVTDPKTGRVSFSGTYNANQISLAASYATLSRLKTGRVQKQLHQASKWLVKAFDDIAQDVGIEAKLVALAGKFQVYFMHEQPVDYRTAIKTDGQKYSAYQRAVVESGVLMHQSPTMHHGISAAHTKEDLKTIIGAIETGLKKAKDA
jgi:glutamate-1-semialdehyde 2,1-aminomutase